MKNIYPNAGNTTWNEKTNLPKSLMGANEVSKEPRAKESTGYGFRDMQVYCDNPLSDNYGWTKETMLCIVSGDVRVYRDKYDGSLRFVGENCGWADFGSFEKLLCTLSYDDALKLFKGKMKIKQALRKDINREQKKETKQEEITESRERDFERHGKLGVAYRNGTGWFATENYHEIVFFCRSVEEQEEDITDLRERRNNYMELKRFMSWEDAWARAYENTGLENPDDVPSC